MYRAAVNSPARVSRPTAASGNLRRRVLDDAERADLSRVYRKMGVDGVRRHLQTSGWHNALADPAVRAFAYEWLAEAEEREARSRMIRRTVLVPLILLAGAGVGYLMYSVPELSVILDTLAQ